MFCYFDGDVIYGLEEDDVLEIIFRKKDNSVNFIQKTFEDFKLPFGNSEEFSMGLENLHKKCNNDKLCRLFFLVNF